MTIADFVADLRAPTPSAAAEMVVVRKDEFRARIDRLAGRLRRDGARARSRAQPQRPHAQRATGARRRAGTRRDAGPARGGAVARAGARVRAGLALASATAAATAAAARRVRSGRRLGGIRARLVTADSRLAAATTARPQSGRRALRACASRLDTLSPLAVLGRGYAVCWTADGARIVRALASATVESARGRARFAA